MASDTVESRLQSAIDACLQDHPDLNEDQRQQLLSATERIARQLLSARAAGQARTQLTPSYLLQSPVYRPLSPAPADQEFQQLEEQVDLAAQRAAALRQAVPAKLREIYAQKLVQLRPSTDALQAGPAGAEAAGSGSAAVAGTAADEGAEGQENPGQERDAPAIYSPDPQQLRERLAGAGSKLPALRARLEEASDRVQRVFAVLTTELNRPPPNTIEKAVLGKTPGRPSGGASAGSPACKQALETGMVSTRKRLGKEVQPVQLVLPEDP